MNYIPQRCLASQQGVSVLAWKAKTHLRPQSVLMAMPSHIPLSYREPRES